MATLSSPCWYCAEYQPIIGHDLDYHLVCDQCHQDLPTYHQITPLIALTPLDSNQPNSLFQAQQEYASKLADFQQQRDQLLNFYHETKTLLWRLLPGNSIGQPDQPDQPTWSQHYQASLKSIALLQDRFEQIRSLLKSGYTISEYPDYSLTPPGRIVKTSPEVNSSLTSATASTAVVSVVVNHDYLPNLVEYLVKTAARSAILTGDTVESTLRSALQSIIYNDQLTLDWLVQYPDWPWPWHDLHDNLNFDINWVTTFPDQNWDFTAIVKLHSCQPGWLELHPCFNWVTYLFNKCVTNLTLANLAEVLTHKEVIVIDSLEESDGDRDDQDDFGDHLILTNLVLKLDKYLVSSQIDLNQTGDPETVLAFLQAHSLVSYPGLCLNKTFVWTWLGKKPGLTADDLTGQHWLNLSDNESLTEAILQTLADNYLNGGLRPQWSLYRLSRNDSFNVLWLEQPWYCPSRNNTWNWCRLSCHASANLAVILAHPDWPWQARWLGRNPNFNVTWLKLLADYNIEINRLTDDNLAKLEWSFLLAQEPSKLPWFRLSRRSDLTWEIIKQYPQVFEYWNWPELSQSVTLAWSDQLWLDNKDKWDMSAVSMNPATTWEKVEKHPELAWKLTGLARNSMIVI